MKFHEMRDPVYQIYLHAKEYSPVKFHAAGVIQALVMYLNITSDKTRAEVIFKLEGLKAALVRKQSDTAVIQKVEEITQWMKSKVD